MKFDRRNLLIASASAALGGAAGAILTSRTARSVPTSLPLFPAHPGRCDLVFGRDQKPVLSALFSPRITPITRPLSAGNGVGANADHPHHQSLWLGHGAVNGEDFWAGPGLVRVSNYSVRTSDASSDLNLQCKWVNRNDEEMLSEHRTIRIEHSPNEVSFSIESTLTAEQNQISFGDTKEGTLALRLTKEMASTGNVTNSQGHVNADAWGKQAAWIQYIGNCEGEKTTLLFMQHPQSEQFPTRWHVRKYGLLSANPFGQHAFDPRMATRRTVLNKNMQLTLRFRIIVFAQRISNTKSIELFENYAQLHSLGKPGN